MRVLVIDDSAFHRRMAIETLRTLGLNRVETAETAAAAVGLAAGFKPDLLLCDWILPDLDGIAFTRQIRKGQTPFDPAVPILLMTGHATAEAVMSAQQAGVDEFVGKPFSLGAVQARLEAIVQRRRPFVAAVEYTGPCRRRRPKAAGVDGPSRRLVDDETQGGLAQADRVRLKDMTTRAMLAAAKGGPGNRTALRALASIAEDIQRTAERAGDTSMRNAAASLVSYVHAVGATDSFAGDVATAHLNAITLFLDATARNEHAEAQVLVELEGLVKRRAAARAG
ncbi:MAG: response regulator [Alphaproteobacteria bacterium]|nr:response regulator [Alphaproteobacteria bacterium]